MLDGWKQFGNAARREGLAFLGALVYDPLTARVVRFFRDPVKGKRRLLVAGIIIAVIFVMFAVVLPEMASAGIGKKILGGMGYLLSWVNQLIAYLLGLLGQVFNGVVYKWEWIQKIVSQEPVIGGWEAVRDICNLMFVLILLGIGFATILRVPSYHIKRLIVPFVIALVLINFSRLICGVVLDFCRILMASFATSMQGGGGNYSGTIAKAVGVDQWFSPDSFGEMEDSGGEYFVSMLTAMIFMSVMLFAFVMLVALLISRWISLMVLTIFSPLAYAAMILPATKSMASKWWNQFMQKAFYGPAAVFMVWLAVYVMSTISADIKGDAGHTFNQMGGKENLTEESIAALLIAVIILLKAVTISKDMGIAGADAIQKGVKAGFKGTGKLAGKGLRKGAGAVGDRLKRTKAGRAVSDWGSRVGTRARGLTYRGRMKNEQKRLAKEEAARKSAGIDKDSSKEHLQDVMKSGTAAERRAAAQQLMANGDMDVKDAEKTYNDIKSSGSKRAAAQFMDSWKKRDPVGAAKVKAQETGGNAEEIAAKTIQKNGIESIDSSKFNDAATANLIRQNASKGQKDKMTKSQKDEYAKGLKAHSENEAIGKNERLQTRQEYARMTGGFEGLGMNDKEQAEALGGISGKDIGKLDESKVNEEALKVRIEGNMSDLSAISAENPEMGQKYRNMIQEQAAKYEEQLAKWNDDSVPLRPESDQVKAEVERYIKNARQEFGRPTT